MKYLLLAISLLTGFVLKAQNETAMEDNIPSTNRVIDSSAKEFQSALRKLRIYEDKVTNQRFLYDKRTEHTNLSDEGLYASIKLTRNVCLLRMTVYHIPKLIAEGITRYYNRRGVLVKSQGILRSEPRKFITKIIINDGVQPNEFSNGKTFESVTTFHSSNLTKENKEYKILKNICTSNTAVVRFYFGDNKTLDYTLSRREIKEIRSVIDYWELVNGIK